MRRTTHHPGHLFPDGNLSSQDLSRARRLASAVCPSGASRGARRHSEGQPTKAPICPRKCLTLNLLPLPVSFRYVAVAFAKDLKLNSPPTIQQFPMEIGAPERHEKGTWQYEIELSPIFGPTEQNDEVVSPDWASPATNVLLAPLQLQRLMVRQQPFHCPS